MRLFSAVKRPSVSPPPLPALAAPIATAILALHLALHLPQVYFESYAGKKQVQWAIEAASAMPSLELCDPTISLDDRKAGNHHIGANHNK